MLNTMTKRFKIGVTGTGGGVGQSILKSLSNSGYDVVAFDGEALAAGLYCAGAAHIIPYASAENYIDVLLQKCKEEQCSLLFPGLDAELMKLSKRRKDFEAIGTQVIVSDENVITISDDKQATYDQLTALGLRVPVTCSVNDWLSGKIKLDFPVILKPRLGGARSKHVHILKGKNDLDRVMASGSFQAEYFIVQEYIQGDEYTCGTVYIGDEYHGAIIMRRILRDGDTYKCFVEHNDAIEAALKQLITNIKPYGACNVQLRLKNGEPYIFEINARCSGTTAARTLCGFNEPRMIADYLLKSVKPEHHIVKKTILRYWNELEIDGTEADALNEKGQVHRNKYPGL